MRRRFLGLVSLLLLAGCNVYHPFGDGVGYTDLPVGSNAFEVTYSGTSDMAVGQARWYCLLRAAELSVLRNDPYFQILDERIYQNYGAYYYPGDYGPYYGVGHHAHWGYMYQPGYWRPYTVPEVTMKVELSPVPGQNTIPAAYLIREAEHRKVELTPGIAERAVGMASEPVAIPPPPPPTTNPAPPPRSE